MCILQLVLTTARAPDSRAEMMGPSAGSFSTRSLTSCVPKSGDRAGMALPLLCTRRDRPRDPSPLLRVAHNEHVDLNAAVASTFFSAHLCSLLVGQHRLTWKNCSCFS